jgi:CBS domain-containing membrane protein
LTPVAFIGFLSRGSILPRAIPILFGKQNFRLKSTPCALTRPVRRCQLTRITKEAFMLTTRDLMTEDLIALRHDDSLLSAKRTMEEARIRHLPIIDGSGAFVGLVTHRDLLAASVSRLAEIDAQTQEDIYAGIPLREVMRADVAMATPDLPLRQAAEVLLTQKYGCLPVVEGGKLVGILTASDFIRLSLELMDALEASEKLDCLVEND